MNYFELINKNIINEKAKLLIFPYAGGCVSVFRKWEKYFNDVKIYVAQYPGRENRITEEPIKDFNVLLDRVYENLEPIIADKVPFYLFGHSLGTKLVYELTLKL
ncbi:MAG: thioesterase II family protein [Filifactoraceae bacterium]